MKETFNPMKNATNPSRAGYVSITSVSSDLGNYLRKVNAVKTLDVKEEKELAVRAKNGDLDAKKFWNCLMRSGIQGAVYYCDSL